MHFITGLSLPYQNITRFDQSFRSLTSLSLPYNSLTRLDPEFLRANHRLSHLALEMNNLTHLPREFFNLYRLEHVRLMGNPVCRNPVYAGALGDLANRGVSPLCGDAPWENRRNERGKTGDSEYSE